MKRLTTIAVVTTAITLLQLHLCAVPASAALLQRAPGGAEAVEAAKIVNQVDSSQSSYAGGPGTESYASFPPDTPVDTSISFP